MPVRSVFNSEVTVANNGTLSIEGEEIERLATKYLHFTVGHVQIIPSICANLVSVSAMKAQGLRVNFRKIDCLITEIVGTATKIYGMYKLDSIDTRSQ